MYLNPETVCEIALSLKGAKPPSAAYMQITEGRMTTPAVYYGWCGDFVTYVLMQAGCRDGAILNRAALNGGKWQPGRNIERMKVWAQKQQVYFVGGSMADKITRGSVYIRVRPGGDHTGIILENKGDGTFVSIDGNSFGGEVRVNTWSIEEKPLRGWFASCWVPDAAADDVAFAVMQDEVASASSMPDGSGSELSKSEAV